MSDNKLNQANDAFMQIMDTVVDLMADINAGEYNNTHSDNNQMCVPRVNDTHLTQYTPVTPIENNVGIHPMNMQPVPMGNQMPIGMPQMTVVNTIYGPMMVPINNMHPGMSVPLAQMPNMGMVGHQHPPMIGTHPGMVNPMVEQHQPQTHSMQVRQIMGDVTYLSQNSMYHIQETLRRVDELQSMINSVKMRFNGAVNSGGVVPNIAGVGIITEGTVEDITNAMSGLYNLLKYGSMTYR